MKIRKKIFALCSFALCLTMSACSNPTITTKEEADQIEKGEQTASIPLTENELYWAPKDPTSYIAQTYNELSSSLTQDDQTQAQAAAKAFLADFLTLKNKTSDSDIGGLDYIPSSSVANFIEYAQYYYYDDFATIRNQQGVTALPEVSQIDISHIQPATLTYKDQEYAGFTMDAQISYTSEASNFKTKVKCSIIKMQDIHYVSNAEVLSNRQAGEAKNVYRVIIVE